MKQRVVQVLKDEGFVLDYQVGKMGANEAGQPVFQPDPNAIGAKSILRIYLKYGPEGERVIRKIDRASRPGLRLYRRCDQLMPVLDGLGISVLSTSKGIMSDRQARAQRLGGELLCTVW
jgi:small subunit ribosomal protein S8